MELTRRDAVAALAALGVGGGAALALEDGDGGGSTDEQAGDVDHEGIRETLVAVAHVVYPSEVSGTDPFVESFLEGRFEREDHAEGLDEAVATLNDLAVQWHGAPAPELERSTRERLLRELGADTADERPDGTTAERVRYYVVNELLLALYASPKGGRLVGIENPQGHPGGTDSYRRGPPR